MLDDSGFYMIASDDTGSTVLCYTVVPVPAVPVLNVAVVFIYPDIALQVPYRT